VDWSVRFRGYLAAALAALLPAVVNCSVSAQAEVSARVGGKGDSAPPASTQVGRAAASSASPPATAAVTTAAPSVPEPPAAHYTWMRRAGVDLPNDIGHDRVVFVDARSVCGATHLKVRLRCWDVSSGGQRFSWEKPTVYADKALLQVVEKTSGGLRLGYQVANSFHWFELDTATGAERATSSFVLFDGEQRRMSKPELHGRRLVFSYSRRKGKDFDSFMRIVDRETGKLEREFDVPEHASSWSVWGDTLYLGLNRDAVELQAYDLGSGRKLMSKNLGKDFLHGIAVGPEGVYAQLDTSAVLVDAKGQLIARSPIDKRGNGPPVVVGDRAYICESGLHIFDSKLKPLGRVKHQRWVLQCSVEGDIAVLRAREDLYVVDLKKQVIVASHTLPQNYYASDHGSFDGQRLPVIEAISSDSPGSRHLAWLTRVPAEAIEVRGLPAGAALLENGQPLPEFLTRGRHVFDVFRPGSWPVRVDLAVRGGQPNVLDLSRVELEPAPVRPMPRFDQLPNGIELLDLKQFKERDELGLPYSGIGVFPDRNRRVVLDAERGMFARNLRTGLNDWVVDPKEVQADAPPSKFTGKLTSAELFAVLSDARLALLHTRGHSPGSLMAYDLDTGKKRWKVSTNLTLPPGGGEYYVPRALSWGGLVWYATDEWLHGFDERDGHVVYQHRISDQEGMWSLPVIAAGRVYVIHKKELLAFDLVTRQVVWRAPISGRGFLALGPNAASLLFVDDKQARLFSLEGKPLAQSPHLGGDVDGNRPKVEPDGIYVCSHSRNAAHLLDPVTLRPRWSYSNTTGESPCPSLFSATQVALIDAAKGPGDIRAVARTIVLHRATGKVLLNEQNFLPNSTHIAADAGGFCLLERKGSVCLDR
jgi:outer membrane protein assembly factor BamB